MRQILIFLLIIVTLAHLQARASQAAFSTDGKHVFLLPDNSEALVDIDLAQKTCGHIDLSKSIKSAIRDLAVSKSGFILCTTTDALWSYDTVHEKCVKVCGCLKGIQFGRVACNSTNGDILITAYPVQSASDSYPWRGYYMAKGSGKLIRVQARYGTEIDGPVFAADGILYFVNSGDLWAGTIGEIEQGDDAPFRSLIACRSVPIASIVDQNTSNASTGLSDLAITRRFIYANYSRIGGSGWGDLIRFPKPASPVVGKGDEENIAVQTEVPDIVAKLLGAVKEVAADPAEYLCASPDGHLVFLADPYQSDKISLIENDGKPKQIEIKGLMDFFK